MRRFAVWFLRRIIAFPILMIGGGLSLLADAIEGTNHAD